jgi:hypothetical protein
MPTSQKFFAFSKQVSFLVSEWLAWAVTQLPKEQIYDPIAARPTVFSGRSLGEG